MGQKAVQTKEQSQATHSLDLTTVAAATVEILYSSVCMSALHCIALRCAVLCMYKLRHLTLDLPASLPLVSLVLPLDEIDGS